MIIYAIENTVNGKIYVGRTKHSFRVRYPGAHWWLYTKNYLLLHDVEIFGVDAFVWRILEDVDQEIALPDREEYHADRLKSYHPCGYNLNKCASNLQPEAVRAIMSASARARWANPEEREAQAIRARGRKWSERTRAKMASRPAHKHSAEAIRKIKKFHRNRPESMREKIRAAHNKPVACSNGSTYASAKLAAESLGLHRSKICQVCKGQRKSTGGLTFWYA